MVRPEANALLQLLGAKPEMSSPTTNNDELSVNNFEQKMSKTYVNKLLSINKHSTVSVKPKRNTMCFIDTGFGSLQQQRKTTNMPFMKSLGNGTYNKMKTMVIKGADEMKSPAGLQEVPEAAVEPDYGDTAGRRTPLDTLNTQEKNLVISSPSVQRRADICSGTLSDGANLPSAVKIVAGNFASEKLE